MEWTNNLISEFLNLYQNEPALWNMSLPESRNKYDCYDAWNRIRSKLKDGKIPINEIKKKRDCLMATYRRQKMKVRNSTKSGIDKIYEPKWPFYSMMDIFLDDKYKPKKMKCSDTSEDLPSAKVIEKETCDSDELSEEAEQFSPMNIIKKENSKHLYKKRKFHANKEVKKNMTETYNFLREISQKSDPDECSLYCELLCKKLRVLKESTRELAMLEIDKLIYNLKQQDNQMIFSELPQLQHKDPLQSVV